MTTPSPGPCAWPMLSCAPSGSCPTLDNLDTAMKDAIIAMATEDLWNWTGRRFGLCEVTVRPCAEECFTRTTYQGWSGAPAGYYGAYGGTGFYPYLSQGNWLNAACGTCNTQRCGCQPLSTVVLPGPVNSIVSVYVDGVLLSPSLYRLDNLGLSRIDGIAWPKCLSMSADPLTAANTFQVTYTRGTPVPPGGQLALGTLACELAKLQCGDTSCRLPKRATTVTREGVTIVMPPNSEQWASGATGLWEVDRWLASVQMANKSGFRITSPDVRPLRRRY